MEDSRRAPAQKSKNVLLAAKGNDDSFFYIHGVVMMVWVPYHCNVNAAFYVTTLQKLHQRIKKKKPELWDTKCFVVHYDNALSHRTQLVEKLLGKKAACVLRHGAKVKLL